MLLNSYVKWLFLNFPLNFIGIQRIFLFFFWNISRQITPKPIILSSISSVSASFLEWKKAYWIKSLILVVIQLWWLSFHELQTFHFSLLKINLLVLGYGPNSMILS